MYWCHLGTVFIFTTQKRPTFYPINSISPVLACTTKSAIKNLSTVRVAALKMSTSYYHQNDNNHDYHYHDIFTCNSNYVHLHLVGICAADGDACCVCAKCDLWRALRDLGCVKCVARCILWNPKVHFCVHKSLPPVPVLRQIIPVCAPHPTFWITIFINPPFATLSYEPLVTSLYLPQQCFVGWSGWSSSYPGWVPERRWSTDHARWVRRLICSATWDLSQRICRVMCPRDFQSVFFSSSTKYHKQVIISIRKIECWMSQLLGWHHCSYIHQHCTAH